MIKNLKTIDEHNATKMLSGDLPKNTGVACPKCGFELIYDNPAVLLLTLPPKKNVLCLGCGHRDSILA